MRFRVQTTGEWIHTNPKRLYVVGFAGRNQAAVMEHVHELAEHGIPAPAEIPSLFFMPMDKLSTGRHMQVTTGTTSGEVEPVLVITEDGTVCVGVGSDHTDREAEKAGIDISKQLCGKMVSEDVWLFEDVRDHWDSITLRSYVGKNGTLRLYQDGKASAILPPEEIRSFVEERVGDVRGSVIFLGTVKLLDGQFDFDPHFTAELVDETIGRSLTCSYTSERVDIPPSGNESIPGQEERSVSKKEEYEFYPVSGRSFQPAVGSKVGGLYEKILSGKAGTDNHTRLLKWDADVNTSANGSQVHTFWEEVYILEGSIIDLRLNQEFTAGMYACRPPGMVHGPWYSPKGALMLEVRYTKE